MSHPHDIDNDMAHSQHDLHIAHHAPSSSPSISSPPTKLSLSQVLSAHSTLAVTDDMTLASDGFPNTPVPDLPRPSSDFTPTTAPQWPLCNDKGKSIALAIDVRPSHGPDELFAMSYEQEHSLAQHTGPSSSPIAIPTALQCSSSGDVGLGSTADDRTRIFYELMQEISALDERSGQDVVPTLPPLAFSPPALDPDDLYPASPPTPGPSSFGSASAFSVGRSPPSVAADHAGPSRLHEPSPVPDRTRVLPRHRSLSNLSFHLSRPATPRMKGRLSSASPGRLARRLFSRGEDPVSAPTTPLPLAAPPELDLDMGTSGCFSPWRCDTKLRVRETASAAPFPNLDIDRLLYDGMHDSTPYPLYRSAPPLPTEAAILKGKGRSNSDPFPYPATFDVVSSVLSPTDAHTPLTVVLLSNAFDGLLPRELRLHVFRYVVELHEDEQARRVRDGKWSALKAAKHRWVGRDQGVRELLKLSRVCKTWYELVFDGALWTKLDLHAFPKLSSAMILRFGKSAGPFVRSLNLAGHNSLQASTLENLTNSLSVYHPAHAAATRLTSLSLVGCKDLTSAALHHLLQRSPLLVSLNLRGLSAVTNETCDVLSRSCRALSVLNMARCKSLSGAGIRLLVANALRDGHATPLRELRLSGVKGITDGALEDLGRAAPDLEALDLSYCRDLHNSSIEAFTSAPDTADPDRTVLLTARQAGRDPNEGRRYRRRITRLRHLSLSNCTLLTDYACAHLAHTLPDLELLELAGIGVELKDDGLILLLETTPKLRKLDLEDASDITDAVLHALTPVDTTLAGGQLTPSSGVTGHALEHLVVSFAALLSNDAMLGLVRACPRLRVLEADSTRLSSTTAREFTALARARGAQDAMLVAVDCRAVGEVLAKELASVTRPRLGWRSHAARRLAYLDGADAEGLSVGQDECDAGRVVLKTFHGWQTVDAVAAARQKRRRTRREASGASGTSAAGAEATGRARWWSPGGRRSSGSNSPAILELGNERDGCIVM